MTLEFVAKDKNERIHLHVQLYHLNLPAAPKFPTPIQIPIKDKHHIKIRFTKNPTKSILTKRHQIDNSSIWIFYARHFIFRFILVCCHVIRNSKFPGNSVKELLNEQLLFSMIWLPIWLMVNQYHSFSCSNSSQCEKPFSNRFVIWWDMFLHCRSSCWELLFSWQRNLVFSWLVVFDVDLGLQVFSFLGSAQVQ